MDAYRSFELARWDGTPAACPQCGAAGRCYLLRPPASGRRTRTGAVTPRRVWKCGTCRRQFSVLTGTVFEGSRAALPTWLLVLDELVHGRAVGFSERARARRYGVDSATAHRMIAVLHAAVALTPGEVEPEGDAAAVLRAILRLDPDDVAAVRNRTSARPVAQRGPSADYH